MRVASDWIQNVPIAHKINFVPAIVGTSNHTVLYNWQQGNKPNYVFLFLDRNTEAQDTITSIFPVFQKANITDSWSNHVLFTIY